MQIASQRGFTLVELMFAALLLAFGVLAAITVETACIHSTELASHVDEASALAQTQLVKVRSSTDLGTLNTGTTSTLDLSPTGTTGGTGAIYTRKTKIQSGPGNSKWLTVTVSWDGAFGTQTVTMKGLATGGKP